MQHYAVLSTGAGVSAVKVGVRSMPAPFAGSIKKLVFSIAQANASGAATFDFKKNGLSIFATPAERPSIVAGQKSVVVSGLNVAIAENDVLSWDAVSVPLGGLVAPVTCTAVLDDGQPSSVQVQEVDGSPVGTATIIKVANGDLEDLGGGVFRVKTAGDVVVPTTLPPSGAAGGDLSGEYPEPVVESVVGRVPGSISGLATLDGTGKLPTSQLPALAISETFVVASEAAMLALDAQRGDVALRTDVSEVYILSTDSPGTLADWKLWLHPAIPTTLPPSGSAGGSLAGSYPNPSLAAGAVTHAEVAAANKDGVAATPSMRTLGTGAQQACAGNDSRLADARTPTGAAGGDLAGNYPTPTVAQLKGRSIAGIPDIPGFFGDNFNDNTLNTALWTASGTVTESSQRLNVSASASVTAVNRFNGVGHYIIFKLSQTTDATCRFYHDAANTLFIDVRQQKAALSRIRLTVHNTGGDTHADFLLPGVSDADWVWLRLRHDNGVGRWYLDSAPDVAGAPGAWTNRANQVLPTGTNASSILAQIIGGGSGGSAFWIDEISSDAPLSDPISTRNFWALMWDNTGSAFGLIRALGIVPYVAAGSPPSGAPSNVPTGHTAMVVETTSPLKLWVWNPATSTWNSQQF